MLRVGRVNSRSLDGPIRLPDNRKQQLAAVEKVYDAWFKVWRESYLPKLFFKPKWYRTDTDLKVGDLVWFEKEESQLSHDYTMGMVEQVSVGRDGLIRRVVVKYFNPKERQPRFTDRAVRSLVRIFSADELCLADELGQLQKFLDDRQCKKGVVDDQTDVTGAMASPLSESENNELVNFEICSGTEQSTSSSDLVKQLELDSTDNFEQMLSTFPLAFNLCSATKFSEKLYQDIECEQTDIEVQDFQEDYTDKQSQLIL